ncbi:hypothetical protein B9Z19DRAFT_1066533 [Tuber borchii]|uniref:Uncharacterized protein n=1 Tax=Tuber borchii TaxID=42251 RepID=A0A2T6ZM26_TUBBO|nr:hypothetical protein B9Z19DRAFT_1066533 [Tuber borchii]
MPVSSPPPLSPSSPPPDFIVPLLPPPPTRSNTLPLMPKPQPQPIRICVPPRRKTVGILLLGVVIFLWVLSTFLTFTIFSDGSYTKPYFVTYVNTCSFCSYLLPGVWRRWWGKCGEGERRRGGYARLEDVSLPGAGGEDGDGVVVVNKGLVVEGEDMLGERETIMLSLQFCLLWFVVCFPPYASRTYGITMLMNGEKANYFQSYCLKWTSVASATILSSTSSIFTLVLSALLRIERFTWTKFLAVMLSLAGVSLISSVDLTPSSSPSPASEGKTPGEILLGDLMALMGAFSYGVYTILLKVRIGHESRISMTRFLGFVGLFNFLGLWPGIIILHYAGVEKFEVPPDARVWWIVVINASITPISDYCWVYAMLLTTPLIVTVGLSLTIPLALLGQMLVLGVWSSGVYWIGAALVFVAFLFVNRESAVGDGGGGEGEAERWER